MEFILHMSRESPGRYTISLFLLLLLDLRPQTRPESHNQLPRSPPQMADLRTLGLLGFVKQEPVIVTSLGLSLCMHIGPTGSVSRDLANTPGPPCFPSRTVRTLCPLLPAVTVPFTAGHTHFTERRGFSPEHSPFPLFPSKQCVKLLKDLIQLCVFTVCPGRELSLHGNSSCLLCSVPAPG